MTVEQLFETHYANIVSYIKGMVRDTETARDIAQEAFLSAYRIKSAEPDRVLTKAWLYKVACNGALSFLRRKKIVTFVPMNERETEWFTRNGDDALAVRNDVLAALRTLPQDQRAAVVLTLCHGYSSQEAAEMLHATADAVRQRVCRGLRKLRALL